MHENKMQLTAVGLGFEVASPFDACGESLTVNSACSRALKYVPEQNESLAVLLELIGQADAVEVERLGCIVSAYLRMDQRRQDEALVKVERMAHTHPKNRRPHLYVVPNLERCAEEQSDA